MEARQRDDDEVRGRFGETDSCWERLGHGSKLGLSPSICMDVETLGILLDFDLRDA